MQKLKRGAGEVLALVFFLAMVTLILLYMVLNTPVFYRSYGKEYEVRQSYMIEESVIVELVSNGSVVVWNYGSSAIELLYTIVINSSRTLILRATSLNSFGSASLTCIANPSIRVAPGSSTTVSCSENTAIVGFVTKQGYVIAIDPRLLSKRIEFTSVKQYPLLTVFALQNASIVEENATYQGNVDIVRGLGLELIEKSSDVNVYLELYASWIYIGYSTTNSTKLDVFVIGMYTDREQTIVIEEKPLSINPDSRFRIKILGFEGASIEINGEKVSAPGIYPCYIESESQCKLRLEGHADIVEVYAGDKDSSTNPSLDAYVMISDLDNDRYPELVFTTEDFGYGDKSSINDVYYWFYGSPFFIYKRQFSALETGYILLKFRNMIINNTNYSVAIVNVRFGFWDNSLDDVDENDNRVIFSVELRDVESDSVVYRIDVSYYELCRYRSVYPVSWSYIVKTFVIPIPDPSKVGNRTYYIAIAIQDPYSVSVNNIYNYVYNDADIIFILDYVGVTLGRA